MPIKIHHGPPGSFKTAGAMADDFIREAKEGRIIVTNVRGVTRDRVLDVFPDLPKTFDVIFVDDKTEEGRRLWATWFHWVPKGAFIFVDEVQDIWPKRWRESDIRALDYPGGLEQATIDDRPYCWEQAWDKHRHWNWDIVATCPAYSKVRDDIKSVADAAYKHKDLALIGWTGRYIEAMHLADDTGKNQNDFLNVQKKKVPSHVFQLYDSTATGQHRVNANGFNLFKNPRVLILMVVLAAALYFGFGRGGVVMFSGAAKNTPAPGASVAAPNNQTASASVGQPVSAVDLAKDVRLEPLVTDESFIVASYKIGPKWKYAVSFKGAHLTHNDLLDMGYTIQPLGSCALEISREGFRRRLTCGQVERQQVAMGEREASQSAPAAPRSNLAVNGEPPFIAAQPKNPA
ncbi:hypothetical protein LZ012_11390 [Dechloromonas sp. XY25]|uniref:Zona occludens toxin N-terminal domain-containing protein n=1 Tax=Dechloromonas hankyongensis TaxID=2908002 RepID=A0ABS9K385_9RHOO|nr:zonular occludens toxin domain-containing protein [Dechloromonas hankyongensis]MCG2577596.1 hypothetical protein [Dechloromonas hankyongensis]